MSTDNTQDNNVQPTTNETEHSEEQGNRILGRALVAAIVGNGFHRTYPDVMKGIRVGKEMAEAIAQVHEGFDSSFPAEAKAKADATIAMIGSSRNNLPRAPITVLDGDDENETIVFELDYEKDNLWAGYIAESLKAANGIGVVAVAEDGSETVLVAGEPTGTPTEPGVEWTKRAMLREAIDSGLAVVLGNCVVFINFEYTQTETWVEQLKCLDAIAEGLAIMLKEVPSTEVVPYKAPTAQ